MNRRFATYAAYKDSGVEWLREIPTHWEVLPLKRSVNFTEGPGIMAVDFATDGVPLLRIAGIGGRTATLVGCNYLLPTLVASRWKHLRVEVGDLLISGSASTGFCSEVDAITAGAIPYTGIIIVRARASVTERGFLRWFLLSRSFLTQVDLARSGSAIQHFGPSHLSRMFAIVPPTVEQRAIAAFLDQETVRIDALVAKKQRVIELLQEKRSALIARAVTKGFDPNVPMKDSGVEWLHEIPAHWEIKPVKAVSTLQTGLTLGKKYDDVRLTTRPYLRVANVQDGYLALDDVSDVEVPIHDVARYELRKGDVLMTEGGDFDKLGRGYVWEGQVDGCLHQNHIFALRPRRDVVAPRFLALLISSAYGRAYFTATSTQSTNLASTNSTKLRAFQIPIPSLTEQDDIVFGIHRETNRIDALIAKMRDAIHRLRELRTALICAAVTGKIDVREESA